MKEYKPIMVFYLPVWEMTDEERTRIVNNINEGSRKAGYDEIFVMNCTSENSRVEIISADKATVVEDIQKYIDEKLLKDEVKNN